jgi:hypothetical protein
MNYKLLINKLIGFLHEVLIAGLTKINKDNKCKY